MYISKKKKIKSKLILTNWDNATTKPYKYKPDAVYCWGKETARLSNKIHNIKSYEIGNIRFENHIKYKNKFRINSQKFFKKKLNISQNTNFFLFAGVTFPFDELNTLQKLNSYIKLKIGRAH